MRFLETNPFFHKLHIIFPVQLSHPENIGMHLEICFLSDSEYSQDDSKDCPLHLHIPMAPKYLLLRHTDNAVVPNIRFLLWVKIL